MSKVAQNFTNILFFLLQKHCINIPYLSYSCQNILRTQNVVCKQSNFEQSREGVQVADRRRWQSPLTSPIGDVGSERVNECIESINGLKALCFS